MLVGEITHIVGLCVYMYTADRGGVLVSYFM